MFEFKQKTKNTLHLGVINIAKISYPFFFSRLDHNLDFISILKSNILVKTNLQVTANAINITCRVKVFCKLKVIYVKVNKLELKILLNWICLTLCRNTRSVLTFSRHHRRLSVLAAWMSRRLDFNQHGSQKSAVCANSREQYNTTLCVMNTDTTLWSFPTRLGLPELIQSSNNDCIGRS